MIKIYTSDDVKSGSAPNKITDEFMRFSEESIYSNMAIMFPETTTDYEIAEQITEQFHSQDIFYDGNKMGFKLYL